MTIPIALCLALGTACGLVAIYLLLAYCVRCALDD